MSGRKRSPAALAPGVKAAQAAARALEDSKHESAFRELMTTFLEAGPNTESVLAAAVLSAMSNGVVLVTEAATLASGLANALRAGDAAYVFFDGYRGRKRCAKLNPISGIVGAMAAGLCFTADDALKSFLDWLQRYGPPLFKASRDDRAKQLARVERGAMCFWSRYLPRVLANDAEANLTLRPLRPQALARRITKQPLAKGAPMVPSLFAASASMLASINLIDGSDVVQQVVVIMTSGDGTKLAALRAQQLQLLEPLLDEVEQDAPALLLLMVAVGICERGTVQTDNPSHSLSARYVRELSLMFVALPQVAASLPVLGPIERKAAYTELLKHAGDPSDGKAALTNADMHLCDALGIEPAGPLPGEPDLTLRRATRYLSPAERAVVRKTSPNLAATPELEIVVRAVALIATTKPVRPGDMRDSMFEDLEVGDRRAVLNIRRRANRKGPKNATAEGPMEFTEPGVVATLKELKAFRKAQAAIDGDPLWGRDLAESRRLYTRACGLIDLSCKHAAGDAFESFYSLRHGAISDEVHEALLLESPEQAQVALKRASRRANHRDIGTTVENYFHLGPEVMHKRVLLGLGNLLTSAIAAKWSGIGSHALDQQVYRGEKSRVEILWQAIADTAPLSSLRDITQDFPCAPALSANIKARLTIEDIANSNVCTQLRFKKGKPSFGVGDVQAVAATPWGQSLIAARTRYSSQWQNAVRPASMRQEKLLPIIRRLRRYGDVASVRKATALWRATAKDGFVDVSDPGRLSMWVTFLKDCGVPASRLIIRVEPAMRSQLELMNSIFSSVTGLLPTIEGVPGGKGRCAAYLLLSSMDPKPGEKLPSAATSMAGFNALMVAASIREDLLETSGTVKRNAEG